MKILKSILGMAFSLLFMAGCAPFWSIIPTEDNKKDDETVSICSTIYQQILSSTSIDAPTKKMVKKAYKAFNNAKDSTVKITACYRVSDEELETIASGFIYDKLFNEDSQDYTYYIATSASGIFYRQLKSIIPGQDLSMDEDIEVFRDGTFEIVFGDGQRFLAELKGFDDRSDVAILSFKSKEEFEVAPLGDYNGLEVGDHVYSIGTPEVGYNLINTVLDGYVSGINRMAEINFSELYNGTRYYGEITELPAFQMDMSLNVGMEGGPIVNDEGKIIGVNMYRYGYNTTNSTYESICFGKSINLVKTVADSIIKEGTYTKPVLGVTVSDLVNYKSITDAQWCEYYGIYKGLYIIKDGISSNTPASHANMKDNEIIVNVYNNDVTYVIDSHAALVNAIYSFDTSKEVIIETVNSFGLTSKYTLVL